MPTVFDIEADAVCAENEPVWRREGESCRRKRPPLWAATMSAAAESGRGALLLVNTPAPRALLFARSAFFWLEALLGSRQNIYWRKGRPCSPRWERCCVRQPQYFPFAYPCHKGPYSSGVSWWAVKPCSAGPACIKNVNMGIQLLASGRV